MKFLRRIARALCPPCRFTFADQVALDALEIQVIRLRAEIHALLQRVNKLEAK